MYNEYYRDINNVFRNTLRIKLTISELYFYKNKSKDLCQGQLKVVGFRQYNF